VDAIREYIQVHYPGNPQVCLDSIIKPDAPKPLRLQALFDMQELEAVIRDLTNSKSHIHRQILVDRGKKLVLKLSKANMRLNDGKIDELIEEFISLL
jgi:hypothetical protein